MQKYGFAARVHVASPRGQARAPTWHGGDVALTWTRRIYMFIKYMGLPCIRRQISNLMAVILYILKHFFDFRRVGLKSRLLYTNLMAASRTLNPTAINAMTSMRWTRSPPHQQSSTCRIGGVSELIRAVHQVNYDCPD